MKKLSIEERNGMLQIYSDFHKDAYGFRPRYNYSELSDAELIADFERFDVDATEKRRNEREMEEQAIVDFEELITKTINLGAEDRVTALKWIWDGSEELYDISFFLWQNGISTYTDKGKALEIELEGIVTVLHV
jgi:uncharacterized protein YwqG